MHRACALYARVPDEDDALVRRHASLIDRCARRIALRAGAPDIEGDLWSAGAMGLLEAARRFDQRQTTRFETFAEHRIRGAMLDELRRMDHLPRRLRARADAIAKARRALSASAGEEPDAAQLAAHLGVDLEEIAEVELATLPAMALSAAEGTAGEEPPPDEQAARRETLRALAEAISGLSARHQTVLSLYYVEGLTYREIASALQVSEPRVCQIHADALRKAREKMAAALSTP